MPEGTDNVAGLTPATPTDDAPAGEGAAELRQLKAVLQNCFGGVDGPIYNEDGEKPTAAEWTALFNAVANLVDDTGGSPVPQMPYVGMIIMYFGDANDLPAGWVFCDGRNGTPNLVGRFPLGWNDLATTPSYDGEIQGGSLPSTWEVSAGGDHTHSVSLSDHTLAVQNLPAHTHQLFDPNQVTQSGTAVSTNETAAVQTNAGGERSYRVEPSDTPSSPATVGRSGTGGLSDSPDPITHGTQNTNSGGSHTHSISGATLPPWGCVFFMMYVGTG